MKTCYVIPEHRAIADLCDGGEMGFKDHVRIITRVNVPVASRGRGIGTQLLKMILNDADAEGIVLVLEISPSDGLDFDQLEAWYRRHGFVCVNGCYYKRRPVAK